MTPKCFQTLENGQRCNALAIHGSKYCRHHDLQHSPKPVQEKSPDSEPLVLPPLLDKLSLIAALDQIIHALAEQKIKRSVAGTLLSSIKLLNSLLDQLSNDEFDALVEANQKPAASRPQPASWQPTGEVAASLAAAAAIPASPLRNPRPAQSDPAQSRIDASTAALVREMVAQCQERAIKPAAQAAK